MDILRSLVIGLYLEQPITWLHKIDPRVKLFWLLTFLLSPTLANPLWRIGIVVILIVLTLSSGIPERVWKQQMALILVLASLVFSLIAISADGLNVSHQPRRPIPEVTLPQPTNYQYAWKFSAIQVSRRSLDVGIRVGALIFTFLYAPTLYLLTTSPEEITTAISALSSPLKRFKIPVVEITLTLTLALRFVPLVLEEIQNLVRAVRTRAINWKKLGYKRAIALWLVVAERLVDNLFIRAEQTASAMEVRGFTNPNHHQVRWTNLKLMRVDFILGVILIMFWGLRIWVGGTN
ncbi:ABC-type cobalt transport system, permease component CbiQ [Synechococcus sp. PCC 7502]|uniref:energy-coupling factor transporter transmembrane component T family protein n=1 Tax=Synechococcus sp. PCC 7502 TaxID=1173263 RepID=UPI00029FC396|nr:energy-coupling factor transporter transmembrane protein EcfT [Synechococcus sp. PCC 7502]AFY72508.1 ABC-type cobalt transport system, permease component CbiQ [Synechococcus sp. PCC 7502]